VTPTDSFSAESASDPKTVTVPAEDASVAILDSSTTDQTTAFALLATVPVKGPAPMTGYVRTAMFGAAWLDEDRNGCDTRNDMLSRDLTAIAPPPLCKSTMSSPSGTPGEREHNSSPGPSGWHWLTIR